MQANKSSYNNDLGIKRLYDSVQWRRARRIFLSDPEHCLCVHCLSIGIETPATIIDHIKPHKGNIDLFWDEDNWQGLCANCHSGWKRRAEHGKQSIACDINGFPIDINHLWNK